MNTLIRPEWKRWFAWYPVKTLEGVWVWRDYVEWTTWFNPAALPKVKNYYRTCDDGSTL